MKYHSRFISLIVVVAVMLNFLPLQVVVADTLDLAAARTQLEQKLADIEQQITAFQKQLSTIKGQKNTLTNKIKQLQNQQAALRLQIEATSTKIDLLNDQIQQTQDAIVQASTKSQVLQSHVVDIIRKIHKVDSQPFLFVAMKTNGLAELFDQIQNYDRLMSGLHATLVQIRQVQADLKQKSDDLNDDWEQAQNFLVIKVLQQKQLTGSVAEQNTLLKQTKGQESTYQTMLTVSKQQAAEIRNRIYNLFNVGKQITFGQAVEIASWASKQSGVPTAFLLAILTQESNLGQNVGTCNRAGDPPSKSWKVIMKPERDQVPFAAITKELGLDPDTTPVSCPMRDKSGNQIGWGGAMGPAQFIPSTWMGYKDKVSAITGKNPASPWDIRDAFMASALKLKAGGADSTRQGQWNAAMRYFSGSTNPAYSFYGDNVLALADKYQADINQLN